MHNILVYFVAPEFDYKDALNLDSMLTDEEIMLRDQFKSYCDKSLMPQILEANRNESITFLTLYLMTTCKNSSKNIDIPM